MPAGTSGGKVGGGSARMLPKKSSDSFIYWDMVTASDGTKLPLGQAVIASGGVKNQGYAGALLNLTTGTNSGDGVVLACSGPTGGGIDIGGTAAGKGSLATGATGVTAPHADDDVVMSIACRFRAGYGVGSPILWTKSYIAPGAGWSAPFNAIGPSFKSSLDGTIDYNVNVGGSNVGVELGDRYALPLNTDLWIDQVKRADGTAAVFINATIVSAWSPGLLTDYGAGEWMIGGNNHTANDCINGQIYFAELVTARLTDAQIVARAKAWLGWT